jgi:ABC-type multidrug transport system ATPase subunit
MQDESPEHRRGKTEKECRSWACPKCCAILSGEAVSCPICEEPTDWIDSAAFPTFCNALSGEHELGIGRSIRLKAKATWGSTTTTLVGADGQRLTVFEHVAIEQDARNPQVAIVTFAEERHELRLPGTIASQGLALEVWREAISDNAHATPLDIELASAAVPLKVDGEITLGRLDDCKRPLPDGRVEVRHAVIVRQRSKDRYWLVDCRTVAGTFVNRKRILTHALTSGDLVQIGPFAWTFNQSDGFLVPASPLHGVELAVRNFSIAHRLKIPQLTIKPREFVAIAGKSGAGKSTLLKALARVPAFRGQGNVTADGHPAERYRDTLGYLSQDAFVHGELTPRQAIEFIAHARLGSFSSTMSERVLRELEVPEGRWDSPIRKLSGGEQKRVRIACELLPQPGLLLLDEPASGLDRDREANLMKLLRGLADRGAAVVVVTHGLEHVDRCDRMIVLESGIIVYDGKPVTRFADLTLAAVDPAGPSTNSETKILAEDRRKKSSRRVARTVVGGLRQFRVVVRRELALLAAARWQRLFLPLLGVPAFFAMALNLAFASTQNVELFGFFCLLSMIWMGATLSLLAIVAEREVFDHEQFLYLRTFSYVAGKSVVLLGLATSQTLVFGAALGGIAWLDNTKFPFASYWLFVLVLGLVEWAAVTQGLFLSAAANRSKDFANLLLPTFMVAQILFSVVVCSEPSASLESAYKSFHLQSCRAWPEQPAVSWIPGEGGWLSLDARRQYKTEIQKRGADDSGVIEMLHAKPPTSTGTRPPGKAAAALSYLTISRYGDIAMRSFAYEAQPNEQDREKYGYSVWFRDALTTLAAMTLAALVATYLLLRFQGRRGGLIRAIADLGSPGMRFLQRSARGVAGSCGNLFGRIRSLKRGTTRSDGPSEAC